MPSRRKIIEDLVLLVLILGAALVRMFAYGDLRLSVGNGETASYVDSSRVSLLSWRAFAGVRLFTTNLVFKLANDPARCPLTTISDPAQGHEARPALQPCFSSIALLQNLLGILAWCLLAWVTARWIKSFPARLAAVAAILAFAFTPQIAEWDSLLSPESLSVTGFVALLALLEEIAFGLLTARYSPRSLTTRLLVAAWLVLLALWVFVRDVNLYALLITLLLTALALAFTSARRYALAWVAAGVLAALFVLGFKSAQDSHRATHFPLAHSFEDYILPFPARVQFFNRFGMPDHASPAYQQWLDDNATRTYPLFLITHPGFVLTTIGSDLYYFSAQFTQPYYAPPPSPGRTLLLSLSEIVHPQSLAPYLIEFLCLAALAGSSLRGGPASVRAWAWIGGWAFFALGMMLFVSFFGDAEGARRHIFPAVEGLRLLMWLLLFACLDQVLVARPQQVSDSPASAPAPTKLEA